MIVRVSATVVAIIASFATAYWAVWEGLGGHQLLSPTNSQDAVWTGGVFGIVVAIALNGIFILRLKRAVLIVYSTMLGLLALFGFSLVLWVAVIAGC